MSDGIETRDHARRLAPKIAELAAEISHLYDSTTATKTMPFHRLYGDLMIGLTQVAEAAQVEDAVMKAWLTRGAGAQR